MADAEEDEGDCLVAESGARHEGGSDESTGVGDNLGPRHELLLGNIEGEEEFFFGGELHGKPHVSLEVVTLEHNSPSV